MLSLNPVNELIPSRGKEPLNRPKRARKNGGESFVIPIWRSTSSPISLCKQRRWIGQEGPGIGATENNNPGTGAYLIGHQIGRSQGTLESTWRQDGIATGMVCTVIQIIGIYVDPGSPLVIIVASSGIIPAFAFVNPPKILVLRFLISCLFHAVMAVP